MILCIGLNFTLGMIRLDEYCGNTIVVFRVRELSWRISEAKVRDGE